MLPIYFTIMKYYKINPGGNITAILKGDFTKQKKVRLAKKIMNKDKAIEQVGFWTRPKNINNDGRLDMAGGEFCGNATRALGVLIYKETGKTSLKIESSGTKEVIETFISGNTSSIKLSLNGFHCYENTCSLPGIKYVLLNRSIGKEEFHQFFLKKINKYPALGIVSYKKEKKLYVIKPIIWVRDIDTLIEETACGSGTLALAYSIYLKCKIKIFKVKQPSGSIFSVIIRGKKICLSGPILKIENNSLNSLNAHK